MKLTALTIRGFRCYGSTPTTLTFTELTAFVGPNGSGKTAALVALQRVFGTTTAQRSLTKEDFHFEPGDLDPAELSLQLEARFEFPELSDDNAAKASSAVPECLRHILATSDGAVPLCRIRLRGMWRKTAAADGDVEQNLEWIDSMADDPPDSAVHTLSNWERSLIQVFYIPASRDAARELRYASGTILNRALSKISWSDATREKVKTLTAELATGLRGEGDFVAFEQYLQVHWALLHGKKLGKPELSLPEADLVTVLRRLDARLVGGVSSLPVALLSEGERSLLYFALVIAALKFEAAAAASSSEIGTTSSPVLTILAVEEPENHLAPYYLSRILRNLRGVARAQIVLTSHSASILRRIRPEEVRHIRVTADDRRVVSEIVLPSGDEEALKYVREAVQAHPELYFASVVVLGEGASEEVVLPRIARAFDIDIDPQFIAVVPLGGRHVHHMWRLLRTIGTPHLTLVDLDMEREEGGWMRLHALAKSLIDAGEKRDDVRGPFSDADIETLRARAPASSTDPSLAAYVKHLEDRFGVFLSAPLDLDLVCLSAFQDTYKLLPGKGRGPRFPFPPRSQTDYLDAAAEVVLGTPRLADHLAADSGATEPAEGTGNARGATYDHEHRVLLPWYRYLFLSGSKPVSHARALAKLDDPTIVSKCPEMLKRLVMRARDLAERLHG